MTYVITEPCIDVKDQSCVEVCPVDCIHADDEDRILYISPDECIDCGACEPACPVTAIFAEDDVPDEWMGFTEINAECSRTRTRRGRRSKRWSPSPPLTPTSLHQTRCMGAPRGRPRVATPARSPFEDCHTIRPAPRIHCSPRGDLRVISISPLPPLRGGDAAGRGGLRARPHQIAEAPHLHFVTPPPTGKVGAVDLRAGLPRGSCRAATEGEGVAVSQRYAWPAPLPAEPPSAPTGHLPPLRGGRADPISPLPRFGIPIPSPPAQRGRCRRQRGLGLPRPPNPVSGGELSRSD